MNPSQRIINKIAASPSSRHQRAVTLASGFFFRITTILLFLLLLLNVGLLELVRAQGLIGAEEDLEEVPGKCVVHDQKGVHVSLHPWFIPKSIQYDAVLDKLTCATENSCRGWTISRCDSVKCDNQHACEKTHFVDNQSVSCARMAACQEATFAKSHAIYCGMDSANTCIQTKIETNKKVECWGKHACVFTPATKMVVNVGYQGFVRCTNGGGAFACQHMDVLVDHASRACFSDPKAGLVIDHCAVVCENKGDCDEKTIQFRVIPMD
ncbi:hypothetical protein ACA910_011209 [Epithemia clementina (nom. ined.)]